MTKNAAEMIVADSESDANLYYATQFVVPDPVYFFRIRGKKYLMLNDLEVDRGKKEAGVDQVLSLTEWSAKTRKRLGDKISMVDVAASFLKEKKVRSVILPHNFPAYVASELQKRKFKVEFRADPFWKERLLKSKKEKEAIRESLKHTGNAIRNAYKFLEKCKIKNGKIIHQGKTLTSEALRQVIDVYLMEHGCLAQNTIVAGGEQGVDPHNRGSGPLSAHRGIVMDVFPRSMKTHYYADMSRSVVKGKATPEYKKMWQTVKYAQEKAFTMVKPGVSGQKIHDWILEYFESKCYKSGLIKGRMQGFFHGTGHGLGLDIHEAPRVSRVPEILKEGMVVTVEPGLYYSGIGGVRIEDVVYVTKNGCEVLSSCPKILEIT